jgi:hypothetical protein
MTPSTDDALGLLRLLVAQFDRSEKLAFSALLITQCNPRFQAIYTAEPPFEGTLDRALLASSDFPQITKLAFAIELLEYQLSQDEEVKDSGILHNFDSDDFDPIYNDGFGCLHNNPKNED